MKKTHYLMIILLFFFIITSMPILAAFIPDQKTSSTENRVLTSLDGLDSRTIRITDIISNYVVDQFPFREWLVKCYTKSQLIQNKIEVRNAYLIEDWIIPFSYETDRNKIDLYVQSIQSAISNQAYQDMKFYYMIFPHKKSIGYSLNSKYLDSQLGDKSMEYFIRKMKDSNITIINTQDYFDKKLPDEKRNNYYFKSDFHWNALGAYQAMILFQQDLVDHGDINENQVFVADDFLFRELSDRTFDGDLEKRFSGMIDMNDKIHLAELADIDKCTYYLDTSKDTAADRTEIIGKGLHKKNVGYNDIYTYNLGFFSCTNENANINETTLIFKDSFQNPTTDMFCKLYKNVIVIDLRFFKENYSFDELIKLLKPDNTIFAFHAQNFSSELKDYLSVSRIN